MSGPARRPRGPFVGRAEQMGRSLERVARASGLEPDGRVRLVSAYEAAVRPRAAALVDDHHPALLHPARAALILLRDTAERRVDVLAAAVIGETVDGPLRIADDEATRVAGGAAAALRSETECGDPDRLAETLLSASAAAVLAALAERLDQLRHLHMRPDLAPRWRDLHAEAAAVWGPVAERTDAALARRYAHWIAAFGRRLARVARD